MFEKFKEDIGLCRSFFSMMPQLMTPQLMNSKLAIEALRISEIKYRSLFENIDQGVIYLDATGVVMSANQASEQLLGLPRDVIIGRKFIDSCFNIIKEDGSAFSEEQQPSMLALRTGQPVEGVTMGLFNAARQNYIWMFP